MSDAINHPVHYNSHPSGIEAILMCEMMGFNLGNALKYTMRAFFKKDAFEDIKKAIFYIEREMTNKTILALNCNTVDAFVLDTYLNKLHDAERDVKLKIFYKSIRGIVTNTNRCNALKDSLTALQGFLKDLENACIEEKIQSK